MHKIFLAISLEEVNLQPNAVERGTHSIVNKALH